MMVLYQSVCLFDRYELLKMVSIFSQFERRVLYFMNSVSLESFRRLCLS